MSESEEPEPAPRPASKPVRTHAYGRAVIVSFAFTLLITASGFSNSVVIARMIGPEGRGLYALAVAILALAMPCASLGLAAASTYLLGRSRPAGQVAGLGYALLGLLTPACLAIAGIVHFEPGILPLDSRERLTIAAAALALPAAVHLDSVAGYFLGRQQVLAFNLTYLGSALTLLGLNGLTLRLGSGWVLVNLVCSYWLSVIGTRFAQRLTLPRVLWPTAELVREAVRYGVRAAAVNLADASLLRLDYVLMVPFVSLADIGLYAIGDQVAHLTSWLGLVAGRLMFAQSSHDQGGERARAKLLLASRLLVAVVGGGALVVATAGYWAIPLFFGDRFGPAYWVLLLLLPASLVKGLNALFASYLSGQGQQTYVVRAGAIAVLLYAGMIIAGGWLFGWKGVAVAKCGAYAIQFAIVHHGFRGTGGGEGQRWLPGLADLATLWRWAASQRRAR